MLLRALDSGSGAQKASIGTAGRATLHHGSCSARPAPGPDHSFPVHTAPPGPCSSLPCPTSLLVLTGRGNALEGPARPFPRHPQQGASEAARVWGKAAEACENPTFLSSRKRALSTTREEEQGGCTGAATKAPEAAGPQPGRGHSRAACHRPQGAPAARPRPGFPASAV